MSDKSYLVFVEGCDYFEVESSTEEDAKAVAVEAFKSNPHSAAFDATVMRETDEPVAPAIEGD